MGYSVKRDSDTNILATDSADEKLRKASQTVFTFGKYNGYTVAEVYIEDESYLEWVMENIAPSSYHRKVREAVHVFLAKGKV